jgi:hypothetical protein
MDAKLLERMAALNRQQTEQLRRVTALQWKEIARGLKRRPDQPEGTFLFFFHFFGGMIYLFCLSI